jgi:hypothetical protein
MALSISSLTNRWVATDACFRRDAWRIGLIATFHLAALALMAWSEVSIVPKAVFLLFWGLLNFFWLTLLRRPAVSAALSLVMIVVLILLSRLKYEIISMTANFPDVWIIDNDTIRFLVTTIPDLTQKLIIAAALTVPVLGLLWWLDRFRVRLRTAAIGSVACLAGITALSLAFPQEDWEAFFGDGYVSKFSRSGIAAISALMMHGYMESDAVVTDRLKMLPDATCAPIGKSPHIILVHDESSFDIRVAPGIKVPAGYGPHFRSFDGRERHFVAEGAGVLRTVLHVPSEFFLKSSHVSMTVGFGAHAAAKIATAAVASARIVRISFRQSKIRKLATVIAATATLVWAHEHAAGAKGDSK